MSVLVLSLMTAYVICWKIPTLPFPYRNTPMLLTAGTDRAGFLTSFDIYNCEETDPSITIHTPFLSLTVWLAAMVHEPSVIALWPSINDSILELQKKTQKNTFNKLSFPAQAIAAQVPLYQESINQ